MSATIVWNSKNYDYMLVNGNKILNQNNGGKSTFTFEFEKLDEPFTVIADTVAMSVPHEIEYTLTFKNLRIK